MGRVVYGASCLWGEMTVGRVVMGRVLMGRVVRGASFDGASGPGTRDYRFLLCAQRTLYFKPRGIISVESTQIRWFWR